jgi:peptidoglycan/xylan/chitin deacetylase (PgdA/CDA1 family)
MTFLAHSSYETISLSEAVRRLEAGTEDTRRSVVVTFDDGFQDIYTEAFPALQQLGFTATVFLPTAYIGGPTREFKGTRCLTWSEAKEMHKAGIDFGSHTVTHPQLTSLDAESVQREVRSSKDTIEDKLGARVVSFSYPFAFPEADAAFRLRLRGMLLEADYKNGVSTMIGTASPSSDRLFLERLPVNWADDLRLFDSKLQGAYDWLHGLQRLKKVFDRPDVAMTAKRAFHTRSRQFADN